MDTVSPVSRHSQIMQSIHVRHRLPHFPQFELRVRDFKFETKPISCSTEARKCRCSILFLFNLHDLFLLKLEKIEDSLSDDSLIVFDWCLGAEITSLYRDDFVAIIQVSGFCQVPEVTGLAKMSILCPITRS